MTTEPTAIHVEVLPARLGDCLLVECPRPAGPTWRMLVDGGPPDTWPLLEARLRRLDPADRHIDVAVITHIDNDHIGGMLAFLASDLAADVGDFWFNGRTAPARSAPGRPGASTRARASSPRSSARRRPGRRPPRRRGTSADARPWNAAFGGGPIDTGADGRSHRGRGARRAARSPCSPRRPSASRALADTWSPTCATRCARPRPRGRRLDVLAPLDDLAAPRRRADAPGRVGAQRQQHRPARRAPRRERRCSGPTRTATVLAAGSARPGPGARRRDRGRRRAQAAPPRQPGQRRRGAARRRRRPATTSSPPTATSSTTPTTPRSPASCSTRRPGPPLWFNYRTPRTERWADPRLIAQHGYHVAFPDPAHADAGIVLDLPARR